MKKQGFLLRNPGEQCSQKWSDLVQTFKDYEIRRDLPGLNHMKQPDFYSELCEILKDKQGYKVNGFYSLITKQISTTLFLAILQAFIRWLGFLFARAE